MTPEEIDKWVEEHVRAPENSVDAPAAIKWGKIIAHKFYEVGWAAGFEYRKEKYK